MPAGYRIEFKFRNGELTQDEQQVVTGGFVQHTNQRAAPHYQKERLSWVACDDGNGLVGALTADVLWDWLYIDELWVDEDRRGEGFGKKIMVQAEEYASALHLTGLWLWTQGWQAADFYERLGYEEFTRFADFPKGHFRIGFRKAVSRA